MPALVLVALNLSAAPGRVSNTAHRRISDPHVPDTVPQQRSSCIETVLRVAIEIFISQNRRTQARRSYPAFIIGPPTLCGNFQKRERTRKAQGPKKMPVGSNPPITLVGRADRVAPLAPHWISTNDVQISLRGKRVWREGPVPRGFAARLLRMDLSTGPWSFRRHIRQSG